MELFFRKDLYQGYSVIGIIDFPQIEEKIGFIHLKIDLWFLNFKVAWKIT